MMLVRDGVEERGDATLVIVKAEVGGREERRIVPAALENVGEDTDEVARLLRVRRDEDLVLEELHQMGRKGPHLREVASPAVVLGRRNLGEPQVLRDMRGAERLDVRRCYLKPVLEKPVQKQA